MDNWADFYRKMPVVMPWHAAKTRVRQMHLFGSGMILAAVREPCA
jgi:hypothetical protein